MIIAIEIEKKQHTQQTSSFSFVFLFMRAHFRHLPTKLRLDRVCNLFI